MTARSSHGWWVSGTEARSTSSPHPEPCDAHHRHLEHHRRLRRRRPRVERRKVELSSDAREALGSAGDIDTSSEVLSGSAIPRLLEASAGADLVVLGSRRWARLAHVVLGSVSEPVVRKSACPTLVVPRRRRDAVEDDSHLTASARS
jgi:nucleotide-binding universal stress UspA family protein